MGKLYIYILYSFFMKGTLPALSIVAVFRQGPNKYVYIGAQTFDVCVRMNNFHPLAQLIMAIAFSPNSSGDLITQVPLVPSRGFLFVCFFRSAFFARGVFELCHTVNQSWPDSCVGAYICSLANPQNLPELMSRGSKHMENIWIFRLAS